MMTTYTLNSSRILSRAALAATAALLLLVCPQAPAQVTPPTAPKTNELAALFPIPKEAALPNYGYIENRKFSVRVYRATADFLEGPIPVPTLNSQYPGPFSLVGLIYAIETSKVPGEQARMLENLSGTVDNLLGMDQLNWGNAYGISRSKLTHNLLVMSPRLKEMGRYDALVGKMMDVLMGPAIAAEHPEINIDMAHHRLPFLWALVAHVDDPELRDRYAKQLQRVMNETLGSRWPEQYSGHDLLTPDGGAIHHRTNHLAYASYSLPSMTSLAKKLQHTPYKLSELAIQRLQTTLFVQSFLTFGDLWIPGNIYARAHVEGYGLPQLPRMLTDMAAVDDSGMNPLMASLYLAKVLNPESDPLAKEFRAKGITPARLEGHWSLNVSASSLHRRDDWLVTLHGANAERRGAEVYSWPGTGNSFCRYLLNGSVMVFSAPDPQTGKMSPESCGYSVDGWNWSHFPGATSLISSPSEVMSRTLYPRNPHPFGGGTWLGLDGIFGMNFAGGDVTFRKSAFFFDNRVTILTSDILSKVKRPAVTTLFQIALPDTSQSLIIDGKPESAFPFHSKLPGEKNHWLIDTKQTGYYVHPESSSRLVVNRSNQSWPFLDNMKPETPEEIRNNLSKLRRSKLPEVEEAFSWAIPKTGSFDLAYLDHGTGETAARPAYTMFIRTNEAEMRAVSEKMKDPATAPYRILQQDATAHVLVDQASKTTNYVVFEPNTALSATGPLIQSSRPALAMFRTEGDAMALSLGVPDGQRISEITLTLQGDWKPEAVATALAPEVSYGDNQTTLTFHCKDYLPIQIMLHPLQPARSPDMNASDAKPTQRLPQEALLMDHQRLNHP